MNVKRMILTFVLLCPYFVFYRLDRKDTPFWQDMIFAAVAFGIGYLVFPDKIKDANNPKSKKDDSIIDQ
jgi:hypothetical protein